MRVFEDVNDPNLVLNLFSLITSMDNGTIDNDVRRLVQDVWEDRLEQYYTMDSTRDLPAGVVFTTPRYHCLVLTGVRHPNHIANVMGAVMTGVLRVSEIGAIPTYVRDTTDVFLQRIHSAIPVGNRRMLWLGHSYGAGLIAPLMLRYKRNYFLDDYLLIQVGPPRSIQSEQWNGFDQARVAVYQNEYDPVCTVMPHASELGNASYLYTRHSAHLAERLVARGQTWVVTQSTGERTLKAMPDEPGNVPLFGQLMWAFTLDKMNHQTHSRAAYQDSLYRMATRYAGQFPTPTAPAPYVISGSSEGGDWGGDVISTVPTINIVQGMSVVAPEPVTSSERSIASRPRALRKTDVVVDKRIIGTARRGRLRRRIVQAANRLKRLCGLLVDFDPSVLSSIVNDWPRKP